jgi:hypothetical protein
MTEASRNTQPETMTQTCHREWCYKDHSDSTAGCSSEKLHTSRIPWSKGSEVSQVHLYAVGPDTKPMVNIDGQSHSLEAAKAHAEQVLELVAEATPATPAAVHALSVMADAIGVTLEELGIETETELACLSEAGAFRLSRAAGKRMADSRATRT